MLPFDATAVAFFSSPTTGGGFDSRRFRFASIDRLAKIAAAPRTHGALHISPPLQLCEPLPRNDGKSCYSGIWTGAESKDRLRGRLSKVAKRAT